MTIIQYLILFLNVAFGFTLLFVGGFTLSSLLDFIYYVCKKNLKNALNEFWLLVCSVCLACAVAYIIWMVNFGATCNCSLTIPQHVSLTLIPLFFAFLLYQFIDDGYEDAKNKDMMEKVAKMSERRK